jgi:hypothetical protein
MRQNAKEIQTVRILRESPCAGGGGGSALVRFGGEVFWQVD